LVPCRLYDNYIGVKGASALAAVLKETQITMLTLAGNELCGLDDEGRGTYTTKCITKLCEGLRESNVTSLNLEYNIRTEALYGLAGVITHSVSAAACPPVDRGLHTRFQHSTHEVRSQGHSNSDECREALRRCCTPGRSYPGYSGLGLGLLIVVAAAAALAAAAGVLSILWKHI